VCGICGFNFEDKELIKEMASVMRHRGPDDSGCYVDERISLGHRRLSIIDLSEKGRQPMSNEEGSIWITYNGETYNYVELREELQRLGHRFSSSTDTEVIVHAYEEYGLDFAERLRGMFALAIWDSERKRLILARDAMGKKPLYYHFDGENLVFASEIKAILRAGVEREIDRNGLLSYLAFQFTIGDQTMFQGIRKVMGGHMLVFDFKATGVEVKDVQYWDLSERVLKGSEGYFVKALRELLEESARLKLRSDVPVGAFLSGGIDSSVAVAFARDKVDYDFHTFSMGFETFSELEYAREVAEHLDTEHHEIVIYEEDVIRHFPRIAWHFDEPIGDPAIIANYFLSREAKRHVKVVLAGEAGDELFAGYGNYKTNLRFLRWFAAPQALRKLFGLALNILPYKHDPWLNRNQRRFLYLAQKDLTQAHLYSIRGISDWEIKWLMNGADASKIYARAVLPKGFKHPLNYMLALDCKNMLPEKYLMKADKATMANSVEERLVILDERIVELAFAIPPGLKLRKGREKYVLRKAGEGRLPEKILWRKKQGFGVPIDAWIKGEMRDYVLQTLEGARLCRREFREQAMRKVMDRVRRRSFTNYHQGILVWTLFALEEWYERCFEGRGG